MPDRFCALVPGEVAWDNCQCGQFAQTIESVFGSNSFPTPATDTRQTPCGPNLTVVVVRASLVRCVHGVSDDGRPPSCAALLADALTLEDDRWAVRRGVACHLADLRAAYTVVDFALDASTTLGPSGGCAGSELTYRFALGALCC